MKKRIILVFCALCFALPALAEINIALVVPQTGSYSIWGKEITHGAEVAIDEFNLNGGLMGQKLSVLKIDDTCSENLSVSDAQMLSLGKNRQKPALVIGPYCSQGLSKISAIYAKARIFEIIPMPLDVSEAKTAYPGMIKMAGFKDQISKDLFEFYNHKFAGLRIGLISDDEADVHLITDIRNIFKTHGKGSLLSEYYLSSTTDLDTISDLVYQNQVQVVFISANAKHTAKLLRQIKRMQPEMVVITSKYIANEDFFENAEGYLSDVYFMALPSLENNPAMAENIVKLRLNGIELSGLNIYGYTAVKMWAELVLKAKSFEYQKLAALVHQHGFETSWGESFFNNGNIKKPLHYQFYGYADGDYILEDF